MTDSVQAAVSETADQITEACDSHLKICLARLQHLGVTGVNREIELEGKKYLVSVKPVVAGESQSNTNASSPSSPAPVPTKVGESVVAPVSSVVPEVAASTTGDAAPVDSAT